MKESIIFLLIICNLNIAKATNFNVFTAQKPDVLIYKGKQYALNSNPLEYYFNNYPDKRPKSEIISSNLWRGYIATFEYIEDVLYVVDIQVNATSPDWDGNDLLTYDTVLKSVFKEVFPGKTRIKVDWYSGILVVPYGKLKNYVHMGYASTYSKYLLFATENGNLNEVRNYRHKKFLDFKQKQFEKFKQTDEFKKLFEELKKSEYYQNDDELNSFIASYITNYTTKFLTK